MSAICYTLHIYLFIYSFICMCVYVFREWKKLSPRCNCVAETGCYYFITIINHVDWPQNLSGFEGQCQQFLSLSLCAYLSFFFSLWPFSVINLFFYCRFCSLSLCSISLLFFFFSCFFCWKFNWLWISNLLNETHNE